MLKSELNLELNQSIKVNIKIKTNSEKKNYFSSIPAILAFTQMLLKTGLIK